MKFMKEAGNILHISEERFKSELKRVVLDERLNTVAYYVSGSATTWEDWIQEGRSVIPPLSRAVPQTAYSAIANQVADEASKNNELLPLPAYTERKRGSSFSQSTNAILESSKSVQFRVPDTVKTEESKKRKNSYGIENSSIGHFMNAPKMSKIQQIYRQRTKAKMKEQQQLKLRQQEQEQKSYQRTQQTIHQKYNPAFNQQKLPLSPQPPSSVSPKINILQNISLSSPKSEETIEMIKNEVDSYMAQKALAAEQNNVASQQPGCSNENEAPKNVNNMKSTSQNYKYISSPTSVNDAGTKTVKVCPIRKTTAKTPTGQKLIIVSNPQTITTPSILQRTLTIPFVKNISMKNFDKFKIVSTNATPVTLNLTAVTNTVANTSNTSTIPKHKILSVKTNTGGKKIISLSHLQALTAKGGIRMLPLGTKIITTKGPIINSTSAPVYIMNSMGNAQTVTKSSLTTPLMVPSKLQTNSLVVNNNVSVNSDFHQSNTNSEEEVPNKSIVLETSMESESLPDDIESHITQLTEIPQTTVDHRTVEEEHCNIKLGTSELHDDNGMVHEQYVVDQNEELQNEIIHENHFLEEHEIDGSEIIEEEGEEIIQEDGEIIEDETVVVQDKYIIDDTIIAEDSEDSYIIIDKTADIEPYEEERNSSMHLINFEDNSQKSSMEFGELEIATENNCAKIQTNIR
ncbi:BRCA2-interacting transcriptional repressor EMSY isoform X2 [Agrilus planipennis]|nr:BRCA2-interacting transcriptional repressor EMSY isoform X2 [Agrilus planipennis]